MCGQVSLLGHTAVRGHRAYSVVTGKSQETGIAVQCILCTALHSPQASWLGRSLSPEHASKALHKADLALG